MPETSFPPLSPLSTFVEDLNLTDSVQVVALLLAPK